MRLCSGTDEELKGLVAALGMLPKQARPRSPAESQQRKRAWEAPTHLMSTHGFKEGGEGGGPGCRK